MTDVIRRSVLHTSSMQAEMQNFGKKERKAGQCDLIFQANNEFVISYNLL